MTSVVAFSLSDVETHWKDFRSLKERSRREQFFIIFYLSVLPINYDRTTLSNLFLKNKYIFIYV